MALLRTEPTKSEQSFTFTDVFGPAATNSDIFATIGVDACDAATAGYNGAVLAFGQTASGKSYSILGTPSDPGLVPRCISRLLSQGGDQETADDVRTVKVAFVEVYNERVFDLLERCASCGGMTDEPAANRSQMKAIFCCGHVLCPRCVDDKCGSLSRLSCCPCCPSDPKKPQARLLCRRGVDSGLSVSDVPGSGRFVGGASEVEVVSEAEVDQLMKTGQRARRVASTGMNDHSSRSHAILIASVHSRNIRSGFVRVGQLYLCDLAGSESLSKSGAARLRETCHINTSLFTLGNVIEALAFNSKAHATKLAPAHVQYRNSKLTRILSAALGGNAKTSMLVTCAAEQDHYAETLASLRFGARAACISTRPTINAFETPSALKIALEQAQQAIGQQQEEIHALRALVREMQLTMECHGLRYQPAAPAALAAMRHAETRPLAALLSPLTIAPPPLPPALATALDPDRRALDGGAEGTVAGWAPTPTDAAVLPQQPGSMPLAAVPLYSPCPSQRPQRTLAFHEPAVSAGVPTELLSCGPDVLNLILSYRGRERQPLLACAATCIDLRRAASGDAIPLWRELFVKHFGRSGYEEAVERARSRAAGPGSQMLDERRLYAAAVRKAAAEKIRAAAAALGAGTRGLMLRMCN